MWNFLLDHKDGLRDALAVIAVVWLTWLIARHGTVWVWTKAQSAWGSLRSDTTGLVARVEALEADMTAVKAVVPVAPVPVAKPVVVAPAPVAKPVPAPAPVAPVVVAPVVVVPAPAPTPVAPVAPPAPAPVAPVPTLPPVKEPEAHIGHTGPERERKEPATVKPD